MNDPNKKTVFVVYDDKRKDMSKAQEFGQLKDVYSSIGRVYNPSALIAQARHVLSKAEEGDYLLIVGDPTLCGICVAVMSEMVENVNLLRWNRNKFTYEPLTLNFNYED